MDYAYACLDTMVTTAMLIAVMLVDVIIHVMAVVDRYPMTDLSANLMRI